MTHWLALLLLAVASPALATPEPVADVSVTRDGENWTADYELHENAPVWAFAESILPRESRTSWRIGTVRVLTPGVSLQRLGNYDALVSREGPLPKRVRLSFTPFTKDIEAGYDPALVLTDGSVALYAGQFRLVPMKSAEDARRADRDSDTLPGIDHPTRMTFVDRAGPMLFKGERVAKAELTDSSAYILSGKAEPHIGSAMTTIVDPALPQWMAASLNDDLPRILALYREWLGPSPVGQPSLLVSWAGPTPRILSMGGSVLPGMVVMTFEGEGVVKPNDKARQYARSFVAHEAAHFWLGQAVSYSTPAESWITEGGAELLAFRATQAADPTYDVRQRLKEARDECVPFLPNGGLSSAYQRPGDFRAYYACGALIALAAEHASGGNFAEFVRTLISRFGQDGTVTRTEWLQLAEERSPGLGATIADLLDKPHADGKAALDGFIARTGISDEFAP